MKQLFKGLVLALATLAAPAMAAAETPSEAATRLALANKVIALMQTEQLSDALSSLIATAIPQEMEGVPDEEADEIRAVIVDAMAGVMPRMFEAMAPVYADIFTVEELRGLIAFYESDLGRSVMQKSYAAAPRLAEAAQSVLPEILPQVMADVGDTLCDRFECSAQERSEMKTAMTEALREGAVD